MNSGAVVAEVRRPPVLRVRHQGVQVLDHGIEVEALEFLGVVERLAHRIGQAGVLVEDLQVRAGSATSRGSCARGFRPSPGTCFHLPWSLSIVFGSGLSIPQMRASFMANDRSQNRLHIARDRAITQNHDVGRQRGSTDIGERQGMAKPTQRKPTTRARRDGLTRRDLALLPVVIGAMASGRAEAEAGLAVEDASLADVAQALGAGKITASALARAYLARIEAYDRRRARPQFRARDQSRRAGDRRQPRRRKTFGAPAAGRRADPGEGQHRHRRQAAHHRRLARPGECARQGRCHGRQAAARGGRGDPGQGEPHRVRQHPRGRDALGLQLAGRPGEEPLLADPARRSRHPARAAGRLERGLRRRRRGRPLRGGDRHRDLGLAAEPGDAERRWSP